MADTSESTGSRRQTGLGQPSLSADMFPQEPLRGRLKAVGAGLFIPGFVFLSFRLLALMLALAVYALIRLLR